MDPRQTMLVTVFGASGFIGTQLVQDLARRGYRIRAAVRRPDLAGHLRPLGSVGQIQPVQANIRNAASVQRAVAGADVVINLVGIGFERGRQRFRAVHTLGAETVANAARAAGATRLIHMSALGADAESDSFYARSKGLGEQAVMAAFPGAIVMRPSIVFGPGDDFFNRFAGMARLSPVLPLVAGNTLFQPVYVGDVAQAFDRAAAGQGEPGIHELGGPDIESFRTLFERILSVTGRSNPLLPVPMPVARAIAALTGWLPKPVLTADQLRRLVVDNVVSEAARRGGRTLAEFDISPTTMDAVLPSYLWRFRRNGQFELNVQPPEGV